MALTWCSHQLPFLLGQGTLCLIPPLPGPPRKLLNLPWVLTSFQSCSVFLLQEDPSQCRKDPVKINTHKYTVIAGADRLHFFCHKNINSYTHHTELTLWRWIWRHDKYDNTWRKTAAAVETRSICVIVVTTAIEIEWSYPSSRYTLTLSTAPMPFATRTRDWVRQKSVWGEQWQ